MKKLAVIDGKSVFYRGYYAMPNLSTAEGTPTGGVFGFVSLALELIKKIEPDYVAVAWDKRGTNIRKRKEIYPEYKAGRKPAPEDFYEQIPILHELLEAFGWPLYEIDDYEADDIMATFARQAEAKGIETFLITSDLDALQIISPLTKMFAMKNGLSNIEEFTPKAFEDKYGIRADQFLDLKSLMGDSSDNLPGVPGVGQKTAIKLLQQYQNLDGIYERLDGINGSLKQKLTDGRDLAYLTKQIAQLYFDVPIQLDWGVADVEDCDYAKIESIIKRLEFYSLVERLPEAMRKEGKPTTLVHLPEISPLSKDVVFEGENYIFISDNQLYIGQSADQVYQASIKEVSITTWRILEQGTVVAYDIKQLYHQLERFGVTARFGEIHDIRQASFLIDPLRRDRSLVALAMDGVDESSPALEMNRLYRVCQTQKRILSSDSKLSKIAYELDFPVIWPLFQMERRGMKLDSSKLDQMKQELSKEQAQIEQEMYSIAGIKFNPASPSQLAEVLFVNLNLPTAGIKKGKTGYSTGQNELDKLRGSHPIIELIERHRELSKLLSTYIEALPKLVDKNSLIHTTFNQDVASTGRLSSTNPNLQNIPVRTELGRKIRQAFVPRDDRVFVSADYSQFELRLAAVLAGDADLIDDFNSGIDIHSKTAAEVYGISLQDVTPDQRRAAKVINFGVLYGMSPHGLAQATKMTMAEAKQFIDHYFEIRKPIRQYIDKISSQAREQGYVETFFGRRRPTPDVRSSNFVVREAARRAAMNMPIQGTEADLMKLAMIQLEDRLEGLAEPVLQIHDSILVECAPDSVGKVSDIMRDVMEKICPELAIKLAVEISSGESWGEVK